MGVKQNAGRSFSSPLAPILSVLTRQENTQQLNSRGPLFPWLCPICGILRSSSCAPQSCCRASPGFHSFRPHSPQTSRDSSRHCTSPLWALQHPALQLGQNPTVCHPPGFLCQSPAVSQVLPGSGLVLIQGLSWQSLSLTEALISAVISEMLSLLSPLQSEQNPEFRPAYLSYKSCSVSSSSAFCQASGNFSVHLRNVKSWSLWRLVPLNVNCMYVRGGRQQLKSAQHC